MERELKERMLSWHPSLFDFQPGKHIIALDGLRGLAILMVILFHFTKTFIPFFRLGWAGVDLFFVLSGFLITGILIDTRNKSSYFKNFISRRALRIFPLYYFAIFILFSLVWFSKKDYIQTYLGGSYFLENWIWYVGYSLNWLIIKESSWLPVEMFNHFWSLAIEEQFYFVWPMFVWLAGIKSLVRICIFLIIGSLILRIYIIYNSGVASIVPYVNTFCRLDALAMGALIASQVRNQNGLAMIRKYSLQVFIFSSLALLALVLFIHSMSNLHPLMITLGFSLNVLLFGSLLVLTMCGYPIVKSLMENTIMVFFGKYSYSLYIFHVPVYYLLSRNILHGDSMLINILLALTSFIISILISLLTMKTIEMPFLKLKHFFD